MIGNLMHDEMPSKDLDAIKFFTMPTEFVMEVCRALQED